MTDHYAVMGNPVSHSRSPMIHTLFAQQTGQDIHYDAVRVEPGRFAAAVEDFRARGGRGLNVTVPFKLDAWRLAVQNSVRAERAQAVNTLVLDDAGGLKGDNTDGIGLVRDLTVNHDLDLRGLRVLLIGAGGAARGVMEPLLAAGLGELAVANRTRRKAVELAAVFSDLGQTRGLGLDQTGDGYDLVINATAASLAGELPAVAPACLAGAFCYDMMYARAATPFVAWAREQGARAAVDGLGMLVEQAAESFRIWRGLRPDTAAVIAAVRAA